MAMTPSTKLGKLTTTCSTLSIFFLLEFMRALLIEALGNSDFTFDQLNYDLYALNKELFNQLNKETTAFFKFLAIKRPDIISDGPSS